MGMLICDDVLLLVGVWLPILYANLLLLVLLVIILLAPCIVEINYLFNVFSLFLNFYLDLCWWLLLLTIIGILSLYYLLLFIITYYSLITNIINWFNPSTFIFNPPFMTNFTNYFITLFRSYLLYSFVINLLYVVISYVLFVSRSNKYFYITWPITYYINWLFTNTYIHLDNIFNAFNNCPGFFSSKCSHNILMYFLALRFI